MPNAENDAESTGTTMIPTPAVGAGSADLRNDSDDPQTLRDLLDRARERLRFYESFDRVVGENTRWTGELMLETVALREQAQVQQEQTRADRATHDAEIARDQARNVGLLDALTTDFADLMSKFNDVERKLGEAKRALNNNAPQSTAPSAPAAQTIDTSAQIDEPAVTIADHPVAALAPEPAPQSTAIEGDAEAQQPTPTAVKPVLKQVSSSTIFSGPTWNGPRPIDVIVHGVTRAAHALSLQRYLRELDDVISVDAREFAGGILRLQIEARRPLDAAVLEAWSESGSLDVREALPQLLELELTCNDAS